jgi:hypothetical protein
VYASNASREVRIPSCEGYIVTDRDQESTARILIQIDHWARSLSDSVAIERRLRAVLHSEVRRQFAGTDCATLYDDSRDHDHPEPGVFHRSVDFRFEPVQERYIA